MSTLEMARIRELSFLYVGGVAKDDIGPMNVGQQKTDKATQYYQETTWETSQRLTCQRRSSHYSHCGEHVSPGKLNNPVPTVKTHIVLDDGLDREDE